ncbi:hypothetical protein [Streptomyces fildesensis]|uniref:hypothetical protein n=1 Tax=Streptomyces fildesensis TaxID=375757 RepID=UPI0018DFD263|nr:hypothetical protein [Streptomyces fildesensis]
MSQTYQNETEEVYAASMEAVAESIRLAITIAALIAESVVRAREREYERERQASEERSRQSAERLRAERAAADPLLRAAWQERFWKDADPRRIGRTWQAASEWAGADPYAAATLEHLREQLKERFGIDVPNWPVGGVELARMITFTDRDFRAMLDKARAVAEESPGTSFIIIIRDREDPYRPAYQGEAVAAPGMPAEVLGAEEFLRWAADRDIGDGSRFTVEVIENTGDLDPVRVPAAVLSAEQVQPVLAAEQDRQRRILSGTEEATDAERLYVLTSELDRLQADEKLRLSRQAEYQARLDTDPSLSDAERRRLTENVEAVNIGVSELQAQQAAIGVQIQATTAALRGENPAHEVQARTLSESLDAGWWSTASAEEIAGVWAHVDGWQEGRARDEIRSQLRQSIADHHGLIVPADADAEMIAELFGGREEPGPAVPLSIQAQQLDDQAQALYEAAFDEFAAARELDNDAEQLSPEEAEKLRAVGERLRQQATDDHGAAEQLTEQSRWLERRAQTGTAEAYTQGSAEPLARLRQEYAERWGRPPQPEAMETLAEEAERGFGTGPVIIASPGAEDPAVWTVTELPEQAAAPDESEAGLDEAQDARRVEASAALAGLADQEAADAVRIAAMGFPQAVEAAVESPPSAAKNSGGAPSAGRERDTGIQL